MNITALERERLEHTLDQMALALRAGEPAQTHDALLLYERAVAIVRERPAGERRVRSDLGTTRNPMPSLL